MGRLAENITRFTGGRAAPGDIDLLMLKGVFAVVGTCAASLLGGWDTILHALILFMVIDYITGVSAAYIHNKLNSEVGFHGIIRKFTILLIVVVASSLDNILLYETHWIRTVTILFFVSNEGISLLENAALIGVPIPPQLFKALEVLQEKK